MAASRIKSPRRERGTARPSKLALVAWWGTALTFVALAIGGSTGVVRLEWSNGWPKVAINPGWQKELGERIRQLTRSTAGTAPGTETPPTTEMASNGARSADSIRVASFNIQVFGTSKLQKPEAMKVLTQVVQQFDVVAIQEVRSVDDTVLPTFVKMINAGGYHYDFILGPRLGRTNSKEQYAFVFDTTRMEVDPASVYQTSDPQDLLHREPLVARFRVRGVPTEQAFTFSLVNIHTDPDETKSELNALADFFVGVQRDGSGEDDIILLGDLNVDEYHLGNLGKIENITHAITGVTTNTRRNKMYDNIVFDQATTSEYTRRSGVVDLMSTFQLTEEQALEVSDHCPVWADFSMYESGTSPRVAAQPPVTRQ